MIDAAFETLVKAIQDKCDALLNRCDLVNLKKSVQELNIYLRTQTT